jgi:hypothetical protein
MPAGASELPTPCSHVETWGKPLAGSILAASTTERRPAPARCAAAMMTSFRGRSSERQQLRTSRSRLGPTVDSQSGPPACHQNLVDLLFT